MSHDGSDEANMSRQVFFNARSDGLSNNFNACSPSVKARLFRTFCTNKYCYVATFGIIGIFYTRRLYRFSNLHAVFLV